MKTHKKESISVNVLAANSQDRVFEWTALPWPESDKYTQILDDAMHDLWNRRKRVTPCDTKDKIQTTQNPGVLVANSEVGRDGPRTRSLVEIENKSKKIDKSAAETARNAEARHEIKLAYYLVRMKNHKKRA